MAVQLFYFVGPGSHRDGKVYHQAFALNGVNYQVGDSVYMFPPDESSPHYVGRIVSAFKDEQAQPGADPHCVEVKWYERRTNLEAATKGIDEAEREVFELEDTDINPIGCISGKNCIVRARNYDDALQRIRASPAHMGIEWFFCRGYFMQSTSQFQAYTEDELSIMDGNAPPALAFANLAASLNVLAPLPLDGMHAPHGSRRQAHPGGSGGSTKRQATGRTCLECGATSTPQWREGPMGPKTLCNACGVRYGRQKHKAMKKGGAVPTGRGGRGKGGGSGSGHKGSGSRKREQYDDEDDEEEEEDPDMMGMYDEDMTRSKHTSRPRRQAAQAFLDRSAGTTLQGLPGMEGGQEVLHSRGGEDGSGHSAEVSDHGGGGGGSHRQAGDRGLRKGALLGGLDGAAGLELGGIPGLNGLADLSAPTLQIEPLLMPGAGGGGGKAGNAGAAEKHGTAGSTGTAGTAGVDGASDAAGAHELLNFARQPSQALSEQKLLLDGPAPYGSPRLLTTNLVGSPKTGGHLLLPPHHSHATSLLSLAATNSALGALSGGAGLGAGGHGKGGSMLPGASPLSHTHGPGGSTDIHALLGIATPTSGGGGAGGEGTPTRNGRSRVDAPASLQLGASGAQVLQGQQEAAGGLPGAGASANNHHAGGSLQGTTQGAPAADFDPASYAPRVLTGAGGQQQQQPSPVGIGVGQVTVKEEQVQPENGSEAAPAEGEGDSGGGRLVRQDGSRQQPFNAGGGQGGASAADAAGATQGGNPGLQGAAAANSAGQATATAAGSAGSREAAGSAQVEGTASQQQGQARGSTESGGPPHPAGSSGAATTGAGQGQLQTQQGGEFQALALKLLAFQPDLSGSLYLFNQLDSAPPGSIPPEALARVDEARGMVELASREAAAAAAAVAAVSQVYDARQTAALEARDRCAAAGLQLKEFLTTLLAQQTAAAAGGAGGDQGRGSTGGTGGGEGGGGVTGQPTSAAAAAGLEPGGPRLSDGDGKASSDAGTGRAGGLPEEAAGQAGPPPAGNTSESTEQKAGPNTQDGPAAAPAPAETAQGGAGAGVVTAGPSGTACGESKHEGTSEVKSEPGAV